MEFADFLILLSGVLIVESYLCSHQTNSISQLGGCIVHSVDGSNPKDRRQDGFLTCDEIDRVAMGDEWDRDRDGCLDRTEFVTSWKQYFHEDDVAANYFFNHIDCDQNLCYDGCEYLKATYCQLASGACPGPTYLSTSDVTHFLRILHPLSGAYAPEHFSCLPNGDGYSLVG